MTMPIRADYSQRRCLKADIWATHPVSNTKCRAISAQWTQSIYRDIQKRHPDHVIAYAETGWPTSRVYDSSYEGTLIGKAGEDKQKIFFNQYDAWVNNNRIISLYFEALDENWKGGFDGDNPMDKAEKHWGFYKADRTPKKLLHWNKSVTLITSLSST